MNEKHEQPSKTPIHEPSLAANKAALEVLNRLTATDELDVQHEKLQKKLTTRNKRANANYQKENRDHQVNGDR